MRYLVNPVTGGLKEESASDVSWTGTQAEWDALTNDEKSKYIGRKVYITDDLDESLSVIAPVEADINNLSREYAAGEQFIFEDRLYKVVTPGETPVVELAPDIVTQIENHTPAVMTGASSSADGTAGLAPQPHAGDEDKVLQGKGVWGHKLQIDVVEQNGVYGYINGSNTFVPFKSQADIDAAVTAARVGNATAADVLAGKTFTNSSASGNTGTLPNHQTNSMIVPKWGTGSGSNVPATQVATRNPRVDFGNTTTYGNAEMIEIAMPAGAYAWSYGNSSCCIPTETKTVTAGTSAQTVTPTEYNTSGKYVKFLKSVTVNPTPTQEKTVTGSRSAQTVTPDSGKYLSKVTVNKYPDASGTYTTSTRGTAVDMGATNNYRYINTNGVSNTNSGTYTFGSTTGATYDMGSTNTYRYVNATNVYNKGKTDGAYAGTANSASFSQYYYEQWQCTNGAGYYICIAKASSTTKTPSINCSSNCSLVKTLISGWNGVSVFLIKATSSTFGGTFGESNYTHSEYKLS